LAFEGLAESLFGLIIFLSIIIVVYLRATNKRFTDLVKELKGAFE